MNRPWKIWLVFGLSAAVLLAVMTWVSLTTLRLDRLQGDTARAAELEERARLALWRMDSWLAPFLIEENAQPFSAYESFAATPSGPAGKPLAAGQPGVAMPSPLLHQGSSNILLHFQLFPDSRLTSPQVPTDAARQAIEAGYVTAHEIQTATARLADLSRILVRPIPATVLAARRTDQASSSSTASPSAGWANNGDWLIHSSGSSSSDTQTAFVPQPASPNAAVQTAQVPSQMAEAQQFRNTAEWNFRANTFQQAQQKVAVNNLKQSELLPGPPGDNRANEGVFKAVWVDDALVLARRVGLGKSFVVQGCWLNWTNLQSALLGSVKDLLPAARLEPVREAGGGPGARMLATLPVMLVPGPMPASSSSSWTALRLWLITAWVCVAVAGLAVALLLQGTLSLSERRAAFVSAVTHELRTPLTTFTMYSEMLAEGMVTDEAKRTQYLATLVSEANRLSHLVENVLAYARLERGSARRRVEHIPLGVLLERVRPRLADRAAQAGMALTETADEAARGTVVQVDVSALEQILFNLVDNACKYAAPTAVEKVIELEALAGERRFARLRVRDHGPGLSADAARRLFEPFSKSAHEAANTAPGVGLGLALCRRLIRSMGGDLLLDDTPGDGVGFVVRLPLGAARDTATPG